MAGSIKAIKMPMIAITTRSSTSVKAECLLRCMVRLPRAMVLFRRVGFAHHLWISQFACGLYPTFQDFSQFMVGAAHPTANSKRFLSPAAHNARGRRENRP